MLSTPSVAGSDADALISRKRPRSPMSSPADPQRLLSFANFTSAVLDAHHQRPAPVVLPGISHLLGGTPKPHAVDATGRQRVNELGGFVERRHGSPVASASPVAPVMTTSEEDDDEAEDKTPWPSANQYHDIFTNMDGTKIPVYDLGLDPRGVPLHPEFIYSQPVSCMYFLKCAQLLGKGSFGFPRKKKASEASGKKNSNGANASGAKGKKESSKDFEWRKMSFVTGLPKKQPIVRYITATCYSRATDLSAKKKVFRMHAVMLADATGSGEMGEYVLVHIRAGGSKRVGLRTSAGDAEVQATPSSPSSANNDEENSSSTKRPVSPPMAAAPSYNSQAASTSPRNKKLLHADFSSSSYAMNSSHAFGKFLMPLSPPQVQQQAHVQQPTTSFERIQTPPPMMRHPMLMNTAPAYDATKFNNARQVMRDMILQSCSSRDEMAKYVHCLQEELAALQQQTTPGNN
ncbi:hypothetical protein Gpo141_00008580 [Globisporangium polare]